MAVNGECFKLQEQVGKLLNAPTEIVVWAGRLGSELATGFCSDRPCEDCPIYRNRLGLEHRDFTPREMVVSVVGEAIRSGLKKVGVDVEC